MRSGVSVHRDISYSNRPAGGWSTVILADDREAAPPPQMPLLFADEMHNDAKRLKQAGGARHGPSRLSIGKTAMMTRGEQRLFLNTSNIIDNL